MASNYTAKDITVLEGLEPVRKRPGMYIGSVDATGLHHLLWEIVDNSVDEAMNGYCDRIVVTLHRDGESITVADNGRGIPVDLHTKHKKPAIELILTTLHAGGKFESTSYYHSGGLHGVGASVVTALSRKLVARVKRDGAEWEMTFERGKAVGKLKRIGGARGSGTWITFHPDPEIFPSVRFHAPTIAERLESKAYLHGGLTVVFEDEVARETHTYHYEDGIRAYLEKLMDGSAAASPAAAPAEDAAEPDDDAAGESEGPRSGTRRTRRRRKRVGAEIFTASRAADAKSKEPGADIRVECALAWTEDTSETFHSFVNSIPTVNGGTHENGLKSAIVKAVRNYLEIHNLVPRGLQIAAEDAREGVVAILSCFVPHPQFQGQTKERLNNPELTPAVDGFIRSALENWLLQNRSSAEAIAQRVILAARARSASRAAAKEVQRKSAVSHRLNLPGKLADCSSTDPGVSELFLVEGDSAGGSAKQGRDRHFQAILPLRGKVLNAEQASTSKVLTNNELKDILSALGCGVGKEFDAGKLRYHKVCLLMDADSDGHHISTLLMTFFFRHLPELIRGGFLYLAVPPLYRIDIGKETHWARDDEQKDAILSRHKGRAIPQVQRFKGLGEMNPATLKQTTLDPRSRTMLRVTVDDDVATDAMIQTLMGREVAPRFQLIMEKAGGVADLDV